MTAKQHIDADAYQAAERLIWQNRAKLVLGGKVSPQWIDGGDRFWYRVRTAEGPRFVLVDPGDGTREPAFDHDRLAAALAAASGQDVDPAELPFGAIEPGTGSVAFDAFDAHWTCELDTYTVEKTAAAAPPAGMGDAVSPDGRLAVFRRGHDLWVRSLEDGREWALTSDGERHYEYATAPDAMRMDSLMATLGITETAPSVAWSPDSTRVLTHRTDQRGMREAHLVAAMPADGGASVVHTKRYAIPGDERMALAEFVVLDTATGAVVRADADPVPMPILSLIDITWAWWSDDGSEAYYLSQPRDLLSLRLHRMDPATGAVRAVLEETGPTRVEPAQLMGQRPTVRVFSNGYELLWYSQRDGWGHLYLYDARTGALRTQVTSGEYAVQEILHLDERGRTVYFTATGLVAEDPYRRTVCRVGLDGTGFARVTDDALDHVVTVPEGAAYFVDSASTTDTPPVTAVRGWDGRVIVTLERADISRLLAAGWTAPERFRATAADGTTDIYGVLYRPRGFDPEKRYAVVDHPYPGPHINRVSPAFDAGWMGYQAESVAALGFVVVAVDGRGGPLRSKAFHDASAGRLSDAGCLADHIAALRQLAATRPWMDLDRVGAFGMSGGGYATARAMLDFPEFYKVGVSICGNHDNRFYHLGWGETYDGPYDEETYLRTSNVAAADRLEGELLLIHGGMDDNVYPDQTLRLADRLIEAGKDFELLIVPGAEHVFIGYEQVLHQRTWDFLVRHLMGVEPPADHRVAPIPIDPEVVGELFE